MRRDRALVGRSDGGRSDGLFVSACFKLWICDGDAWRLTLVFFYTLWMVP